MSTPSPQLPANAHRKGGPRPGAGRPEKARLVGSICEHFRPYAKLFGIETYMLASEAARLLAPRYPLIAEALRRWDSLKKRQKMRHRALDTCVIEAGMPLDHFKALVSAVLLKELQQRAESETLARLPELVERSIHIALTRANSRERILHLQAHALLLPPSRSTRKGRATRSGPRPEPHLPSQEEWSTGNSEAAKKPNNQGSDAAYSGWSPMGHPTHD